MAAMHGFPAFGNGTNPNAGAGGEPPPGGIPNGVFELPCAAGYVTRITEFEFIARYKDGEMANQLFKDARSGEIAVERTLGNGQRVEWFLEPRNDGIEAYVCFPAQTCVVQQQQGPGV